MCVRFLGFVLVICLPAVQRAQRPEPQCDSPQLQGGFFVLEEDTESHEIKLFYACDDGLKPAVEGWWGTATCQNNTWIPTPQCIDENACIPPEIPNASYIPISNGWHQRESKIRVRCNDGYEAERHHATSQCVGGTWISLPVCKRDANTCGPPPKTLNAVIINQVHQEMYLENSMVDYACEDGYISDAGAIQRSYCSFGNWSMVSECLRIPSDPDTDTDTDTDTHSSDSTPTGSSTADGDGEDTGPFLSTDKCGRAPIIHNGDVVEKNLKYLKYQCNAFYTLDGADTVVCHSDRSWSNPPTCLDNFCVVDTSKYEHLQDIGNQYVKSGDRQEFHCHDSSDTSYGHCDNKRITFGRCCSSWSHYLGYCT